MSSFKDDAELIHAYTRAQAIEDSVLIDVSETAREAGFVWPFSITRALDWDIKDIPKSKDCQDQEGRLWDVLFMAMRRFRRHPFEESFKTTLYQRIVMHVGRTTYYTVKPHFGPGDNGEPVVTLMRADED